jgi:hypothetical protein
VTVVVTATERNADPRAARRACEGGDVMAMMDRTQWPAADWERAGVRLYCADALALLPQLPAGGADAAITDPPYNVGFAYAGDATNDRKPNYANWCAMAYEGLRRATSGPIAVSVGAANVGVWSPFGPDWWLAWHKPASMGRCTVGFNNWEPVALFGKSRGRTGTDVITAPIMPQAAAVGGRAD